MKKIISLMGMFLVITGCAVGSIPTPEQLSKETFIECPSDYQLKIKNELSRGLFDPYSAVFSYGVPEKYVYKDVFGYRVLASVNAKNRFGGYVGAQTHMFMCFPDGTVEEINAMTMGLMNGLQR